MPTYAYVCQACAARRDVMHSMRDNADVTCTWCGEKMRKDVGASFPHVSLKWHKGQGIGEKLVLQSTKRVVSDGNSGATG